MYEKSRLRVMADPSHVMDDTSHVMADLIGHLKKR